jgi:hypothetical protein
VGVLGGSAAAQARVEYAAVASGSGARTTYEMPGYILVDTLVDGGSAVAQSALESSGLSRAFASFPYPGDIVVTLGGTAAAFGVGPAGAVTYPFYALADPANPEAHVQDPTGALQLDASSTPTSARSSAVAGSGLGTIGQSGLQSEARSEEAEDGTVVAEATTVSQGITLGDGLLVVGRVRSTARATMSAEGAEIETDSSTVVDSISVAGINLSFGSEGLSVAGQQIPGVSAELLAQVTDLLSDQGVSIEYVRAEPVEDGVVADTVHITQTGVVPAPGSPEGTLTVILGGASAHIRRGAPAPAAEVPAAPVATPSVDLGPTGSSDASAPPLAVPATTATTVPTEAVAGDLVVASDLFGPVRFFDLVLCIGGLVAALGSVLWRRTPTGTLAVPT